MKYDIYARAIKLFIKGPVYKTLRSEIPALLTVGYKRRVNAEYRAIVERTAGIGGSKNNPMEMILLFLAFLIAIYKAADGQIDEMIFDKVVDNLVTSWRMKKISQAEAAFSKKAIDQYRRLADMSQQKKYQNDWLNTFEYQEGSGEYFLTYSECGICKVAQKEGVFHLAKYLCKTDYPSFGYKGVVLDRTKTLAYGDDCCNFHIMTKQKAAEIGFKMGKDAK